MGEFVKMFLTVENRDNGVFIHIPEIVETSVGVTDDFNRKLIEYLDIDLDDQNVHVGEIGENGIMIEYLD